MHEKLLWEKWNTVQLSAKGGFKRGFNTGCFKENLLIGLAIRKEVLAHQRLEEVACNIPRFHTQFIHQRLPAELIRALDR